MAKEIDARSLDEYITTDFQTSMLIAREISRQSFLARMEPIMTAVGKALVEAGADFSGVDISLLPAADTTASTEEEK